MKRINIYSLKKSAENSNFLIKECGKLYDLEPCTSPDLLSRAFNEIFNPADNIEEHFYLLAFDTKLNVVGAFDVAHGTADSCPVDLKSIFSRLALVPAVAFAVSHNHPSGDLTPSKEDIALTDRIQEAAQLLDYRLLDHIIISETGHKSEILEILSQE